MRGAMTLFMSWLFWKKGGMTWDKENFANVIDLGGISFLRQLISSETTGWNSIGMAFGKPTNQLFSEMVYELNCQRLRAGYYQYKTDPLTSEPVEFFTNMGVVSCGDITLQIGHPVNMTPECLFTSLPWSFQFYNTISTVSNIPLLLQASDVTGEVYFSTVTATQGE